MTDRISSKADVLKSLYGKLKYSRVEKLKIVTGAELDADSYGLAAEIAEEFANELFIFTPFKNFSCKPIYNWNRKHIS